eukprot:TRINITY_DN1883_c8_g1_i2.p1 TRINITY_DN1883_c8_g1~~TRINITY_DN1883_c8_g1_i2.p1  ORF type:complete len:104 (-),score=18.48 TRINITY_DN1883_c8_g1_i2:4-315(-)
MDEDQIRDIIRKKIQSLGYKTPKDDRDTASIMSDTETRYPISRVLRSKLSQKQPSPSPMPSPSQDSQIDDGSYPDENLEYDDYGYHIKSIFSELQEILIINKE